MVVMLARRMVNAGSLIEFDDAIVAYLDHLSSVRSEPIVTSNRRFDWIVRIYCIVPSYKAERDQDFRALGHLRAFAQARVCIDASSSRWTFAKARMCAQIKGFSKHLHLWSAVYNMEETTTQKPPVSVKRSGQAPLNGQQVIAQCYQQSARLRNIVMLLSSRHMNAGTNWKAKGSRDYQ